MRKQWLIEGHAARGERAGVCDTVTTLLSPCDVDRHSDGWGLQSKPCRRWWFPLPSPRSAFRGIAVSKSAHACPWVYRLQAFPAGKRSWKSGTGSSGNFLHQCNCLLHPRLLLKWLSNSYSGKLDQHSKSYNAPRDLVLNFPFIKPFRVKCWPTRGVQIYF